MPTIFHKNQPPWFVQVARLGRALLDLLYPPRCAGCGRLGALFCASCQSRIARIPPDMCYRCGRPSTRGRLCARCSQNTAPALDGIVACAAFAPPLRDAIHKFKYRNIRGLAEPLGAIMASCWVQSHFAADLIVAVPLHAARYTERGYNQSLMLAKVLARQTDVPLDTDLLVRRRATVPQVTLKPPERRQNVDGAFECLRNVHGASVVIIDDVSTTGATIEACATTLRSCGASRVWGFVLARPLPGISPLMAEPAKND